MTAGVNDMPNEPFCEIKTRQGVYRVFSLGLCYLLRSGETDWKTISLALVPAKVLRIAAENSSPVPPPDFKRTPAL